MFTSPQRTPAEQGRGIGMTLNKTSIEWCDRTWNPVTGCLHGCPYCYAKKIAERFKGTKAWPEGFRPMFHQERLRDPSKVRTPQTIFVCSMADLFGEWVPWEWQEKIFNIVRDVHWHNYIFLTKNPFGMVDAVVKYYERQELGQEGCSLIGDFLSRTWWGVSVTCQIDTIRINMLRSTPSKNLFVSFEPLLRDVGRIDLTGIKQVIIGAQTNPSVEVTPEMVQPIGKACQDAHNIPMFCKDSMPMWAVRRELAWPLHKSLERPECRI
jgi:protein gp37